MIDNLRYYYYRFRPLWVVLGTIVVIFGCSLLSLLMYLHWRTLTVLANQVLPYAIILLILIGIASFVNDLLPKDARKKKKNDEGLT